jgi:hypothetical protein
MRKTTKHKQLVKIIKGLPIPKASVKSNDAHQTKMRAEFKKEELELEKKKLKLHKP